MLKEHMPEKAQPESPERTCLIMTYNLGYVVHEIVYGNNRKTARDPTLVSVHFAEARLNLADLMTQCRLLAEQMGWDEQGLREDGEERFIHRMWELQEGVI